MVALHTAIAIVLAVGLIIRLKVDPVISLILASLYLGLASGVGFTGTIEAIATGFGEIMAEVGLLIGFGVLIGAFLHAAGAFHRLLDVLVRGVGATRLPYALSLLHSTIFPSIYVDVQVVLASPVARSAAPYIGATDSRCMASALGAGIFAGYVFVIPGLAAISIAGLLDMPLGTWLLFGIVIGPVTAIVTTHHHAPATARPPSGNRRRTKMSTRRWPSKRPTSWLSPAPRRVLSAPRRARPAARPVPPAPRRVRPPRRMPPKGAADAARSLPLGVLLLPILVPLLHDRLRRLRRALRLLQLLHRVPRQRQPCALRRPRWAPT